LKLLACAPSCVEAVMTTSAMKNLCKRSISPH
jgi:hypothetical protein